jgi:hypothetical protein
MSFKKFEFSRQGNFILALLLVHFVFFGYICNVYERTITEEVLFLHLVLFNPTSYFAFIILFAIVFILVFREQFFEYGLRNSMWLIPFIIFESWIWYWFIIMEFDITVIGMYFLRFETYITIFTLFGIILISAIIAAAAKEKYKSYIDRIKKLKTN